MCDSFECKTYASLFDERVGRQKKVITVLLCLALLCLFVGASLIIFALVLGDLKQNLWMEVIKTSLGLVVSGTSVATWKEVLDRWVGLVPFTNLNSRLANCDSLPPNELEVTCNLAKSFLNKL
jgi:hypothetical protein